MLSVSTRVVVMVKSRKSNDTFVGFSLVLALTPAANQRLAGAATHIGVQTAQTPTQSELQHHNTQRLYAVEREIAKTYMDCNQST